MTINYILIDGSYFIFYRFYALLAWWKLAKPDENMENPAENPEFVEKFKKTFKDKIAEIPKKLKLKDYKTLVALDCPRKEIWRKGDHKIHLELQNELQLFQGIFPQ